MPGKTFSITEDLDVVIFKRRGSRNIRLSIGANGVVRVTMPSWAPYKAGVEFARAKQEWILEQRVPSTVLHDGMAIGKAHHLRFAAGAATAAATSRTTDSEIWVRYPTAWGVADERVQATAQKASIKALRAQAERLLPQRLAILAEKHEFTYNQVSIKQLKGRWGSCDQHQNIVLNLYLMQLPWELIDYVLLHELTHTRILRHGPDFWQAMTEVLPTVKFLRKKIREHHPVLS